MSPTSHPGIANAEAIRKLSGEMQAQRGREMPGFLSSQVFYSQLVEHVELWRPVVEICQQQVVLQTHRVVAELAHSISPEFPLLATAIKTLAAEVMHTSLHLIDNHHHIRMPTL